ncbi:MAG TPA: SusC/RagA family TonB-linked outer membrane protein, partial [Dysgonomonas sp.]|nr:SusC/RagA family TonB-linked outer membrane protein [Dysgonomonas sp.]
MDGQFRLSVPQDAVAIVVSYLGYEKQEIQLGSQTSFNITLKENASILDEVVVTALGIKRDQKALGYSVQRVGGDAATTVKGVDIGTSLTGKIAGLMVTNSPDFNSSPGLTLRGAT